MIQSPQGKGARARGRQEQCAALDFRLDFGAQIITQEGVTAKTENATLSKLKVAQSVS